MLKRADLCQFAGTRRHGEEHYGAIMVVEFSNPSAANIGATARGAVASLPLTLTDDLPTAANTDTVAKAAARV